MHMLVHFASVFAMADDPRPAVAGVVPFRLKVDEHKTFEVVTTHWKLRVHITDATVDS